MKDRLQELAEIQRNRDFAPEYEETETQFGDNSAKNAFLDDFFRQIEEIQQSIKGITDNVQKVKKIHSAILSAPQADQGIKESLENTMEEIKKTANRVKASLKNMERSIKDQESAGNGNYADIRIKKCQHAAFSREFVDVMSEYNKVQNDYREKCKDRIKRQLAITNRSTTDDEFEEMLDSGNQEIFTQGIIVDNQQTKQSLRDIEARHNDIIKLENSIKELHEMFTDMAILVQSQGEMINKIEYNVDQATDYVQKGVSDTKKAFVYQSKARRKKIMIAICVLIALLIIGVIIYVATR